MTSSCFPFIFWFVLWILISWPPETKDFISGALASLFITFMTADVMIGNCPKRVKDRSVPRRLSRLAWFVCYVFVFLWECLKANIDVAYRVIHPRLPIKPGTIKVKVSLSSDVGLTFLANSITLTPGTTTVDVDKERGFLYIHMLYVKEASFGLRVVSKFENILKRIFE